MGQYWIPVNLDKKEYIEPHKLACGLKLWEQLANEGVGLLDIDVPEARGGGDLDPNPIIGRWAGDRIAIVGDYAEDSDLPAKFKAARIYDRCVPRESWAKYAKDDKEYRKRNPESQLFKDVTDEVCAVIEHELEGKFEGSGWRTFKRA